MIYRFNKLAWIIKRLNLPHDLESFENRLILQKAIYLLQFIGMDLNYDFSWYLYGPYSPELAAEAFAILPILEDLADDLELTDVDFRALIKMDEIAEGIKKISKELEMDIVDVFELTASITFIVSKSAVYDDMDFVVSKLIILKPKFKKKKIEYVYNMLKSIGVF